MRASNPITRRSFLGAAGTTAALLAAASAVPSALGAGEKNRRLTRARAADFPKDFWWGAATAAYQIEGAASADGRGPSIWDTFSHLPGKTTSGHTGDVACDHYHRFAGDVKLMAELGVKHYRFSLSWSRILPAGCGQVNEAGMDFYRRLTDALLAHGITPHATLYHWDLPQALQDRYAGWQSREVVNDFGNYATAVVQRLGDRVRHWMTLNEIASFCYYGGYGVNAPAIHAPGVTLKSAKERWQVIHHALLAHGTACQAIRAASPGQCNVAAAENFSAYVPVIETEENIAAAHKAFVREEVNGGLLLPLLTGRYGEGWLADRGADAPDIAPGDLKLIGQPLDSLGFNCYSGTYVRAAANAKGYETLPWFDGYPKGNIWWLNIVPDSIYWGVRQVGEAAGQKKLPIFISENGCADGGQPVASGEMLDTDRVMFYRAYLHQARRAIAEGYPLVGFFPWSLLDNFEWADGYTKRLGLIRVNFETQQRTPKLAYRWYQQLIRENRIV